MVFVDLVVVDLVVVDLVVVVVDNVTVVVLVVSLLWYHSSFSFSFRSFYPFSR